IAVGFDDLISIAGPQNHEPWDGAHGRKLFHGLMRRAILAIAHSVMSENKNGRQFHDRGKPHRRARIVAEYEKSRTKGPELRQREASDRRHHGMLPDAEMQVSAAGRPRFDVARAFKF